MSWFKKFRGSRAAVSDRNDNVTQSVPEFYRDGALIRSFNPAVAETLGVFVRQVQTVASIDESQMHTQYDKLRRTWPGQKLVTGGLSEITDLLQANLEREVTHHGDRLTGFQVRTASDQGAVYVVSKVMEAVECVNYYFVWRTPGAIWFSGTNGNMIVSLADRLTRVISVVARPEGGRVQAATVSQALGAFAKAIDSMPIIDAQRVMSEYHALRGLWWGGRICTGTVAEITDLLRMNLERDAGRPGHAAVFLVDLYDDKECVQVESLVGDQSFAYRVWRTPAAVGLLANSKYSISPIPWNFIKPQRSAPLSGQLEHTAYRLAALMDALSLQDSKLTEAQQEFFTDAAWERIDAMVRGEQPTPEWIKNWVEVRAIGYSLNSDGGKKLMQTVASRADTLSRLPDAIEGLNGYWDAIGDWQA